jgi:hypothetical protein
MAKLGTCQHGPRRQKHTPSTRPRRPVYIRCRGRVKEEVGQEGVEKGRRGSKMKWIYIQVKGWHGLGAIMIPPGLTVSELKLLLGLDLGSNLLVPASFFPLPGGARLDELLDEFDTVYIEP